MSLKKKLSRAKKRANGKVNGRQVLNTVYLDNRGDLDSACNDFFEGTFNLESSRKSKPKNKVTKEKVSKLEKGLKALFKKNNTTMDKFDRMDKEEQKDCLGSDWALYCVIVDALQDA